MNFHFCNMTFVILIFLPTAESVKLPVYVQYMFFSLVTIHLAKEKYSGEFQLQVCIKLPSKNYVYSMRVKYELV